MHTMVERAEVIEMLEESIQALPGSAANTPLGDLDGWDSMGMVIFVELVAQKTRAKIAVHEVRACTSVDELVLLIRRMADA